MRFSKRTGSRLTLLPPRSAGTNFAIGCGSNRCLASSVSTAMQTRDLQKILQRATELCAIGLQAPFVKVLEYEPDENRLMVRAGVGWAPGTIDAVSLAADIGSPAGYAYQTGASVISNHLEVDTRFRTPRLLADHGVRRPSTC